MAAAFLAITAAFQEGNGLENKGRRKRKGAPEASITQVQGNVLKIQVFSDDFLS